MKILGTGLSGLVGSYVVQQLSQIFEFENLSLETGVDITNPDVLESVVSQSDASWVFHFAAKTDVDQAEKEKDLGEKSPTWIVNVGTTRNLVSVCKKYGKKLLYISTDFVFPGGNKVFSEDDEPNPIGWYATTKYLGEKEVQKLGNNSLIVRISFPYGSVSGPRPDFVGRILELLRKREEIQAPVDQIFVPTHLETISDGLRLLVSKNAFGVYHVVGSEVLSSYDAVRRIAHVFGYDESKIKKITAEEFYRGRASRPFQLVISNARITKLGLHAKSFQEGLEELKQHL